MSPSSRLIERAFVVGFVQFLLIGTFIDCAADEEAASGTTITTVDTCSDHEFDCHGCAENGCYYCPLTGMCYATASMESKLFEPGYSCQVPDDFITSSSSSSSKTTCDNIPSAADYFFSDPLVSIQRWAYDMIDVESVWREKGYFGVGVHVRVNDNNLYHPSHPEFGVGEDSRIDWSSSCEEISREEPDDSETDGDGEDRPRDVYSHGMAVASIIGAEGDNGVCAVGVAPQVTLSFCASQGDIHDFLSHKVDDVDISHNSWAQPACMGHIRRHYQRKLRESLGRKDGSYHQVDGKNADLFQCPFSYRPQGVQNVYNLTFPCDSCPEFSLGLRREGLPDTTLNEGCSKAIKDHCYVYFDQDYDACIEHMDLLLEDGRCEFGGTMPEELQDVLTEGVTLGRKGKGIIYIFSSGNAFMSGDDAGLQPYAQNTRYTITVGAVAFDGQRAWYSSPSAKVLVSAPGGDYRLRETQMVGAALHGTCGDSGSGTSFSAPVVSGVVALMLEANPDLTWRDVQAILASTSKRPEVLALPASTMTATSPFVDETEAVNGAGYWHSHYYGFGIVNAAQAVEAAETWVNLGPEKVITASTGLFNYTISDDATRTLVTNLTVPANDTETGRNNSQFVVETVYLSLSIHHSSRGHLKVKLTSPQGMESVVSPGNRPESGQAKVWKFTTVRSWGESPVGNWTLSITDTQYGDVADCLDAEWMYQEKGEELPFTCKSLEALQYCEKGLVDPYGYAAEDPKYDSLFGHVDDDKHAIEACCACGGGVASDRWPETLLSWAIEVFGHDPMVPDSSEDDVVAESPSECQSIGKEFH